MAHLVSEMAAYGEQSPQDEGYSEDPLTAGVMSVPSVSLGPAKLTVAERTEYVMRLLDQLPTSSICEIVQRLSPRLYINFFQYLPAEICLKILGFLDPRSLIRTAQASREWMLLALDRKLWEELYILEGFRVIPSEVQSFEAAINTDRPERTRPYGSEDEHASKRRATPQRILASLQSDNDHDMMDADMVSQPSMFGSLTTEPNDVRPQFPNSNYEIQSASPKTHPPPSQGSPSMNRHSNSLPSRTQRLSIGSSPGTNPRYAKPGTNLSSFVVVDRGDGRKKLNWQYLFSQRRRLEANWEAERYTNFQLPHPNYLEEAHDECIYTIQHCGKYLVSGSRDRSLRIWNLNSQRLVRAPLRAHTGSVLCLQFDADPEEDLIVSGSSDATVVLWRFSNGQVIQRLKKAHRESVLNVRFDKRVLITCSKDKTIKIFNRRPLYSTGSEYSGAFSGVNPVATCLDNYGYNPSPSTGILLKTAYSMIGCLEGHGAAVNAVQIHGDEIVSASGDRTVKLWNWKNQTCIRSFVGHAKGIACVQYDGRRIVSGSSDNEVKVFDKSTGLEVASLRAHTHLVRTVQAGFGDLPYSSEDDPKNAKRIDQDYFKAVESGAITREMYCQKGRPNNAGSKKLEDITAYGAKLPPGGGGGRFARIVSGSYDETIIIWRRDKEGVWRAQHTLRQEEAAHAASNTAIADTSAPLTLTTPQGFLPNGNVTPAVLASHNNFYHHLIDMVVPQGAIALRSALQAHPQLLTYDHLTNVIQTQPVAMQQALSLIVMQAIQTQPTGNIATLPVIPQNNSPTTTTTSTTTSASSTPPPTNNTQAPSPTQTNLQAHIHNGVLAVQNNSTAPSTHVTPTNNAVAATPPAPTNPPAAHQLAANNIARVFKLQFDARRIICCSQTSTIVGWDFANGDEELIAASRFFAPVE
ncbi:WD40-repeat-containing domain protein [Amylocarpus encephaloides]|uniref:WD40-repeat-containing domain protein n=1 Tax=Amylocarpus encephaloides TaxID=45428 RepID=A0A9P8CAN6_9HELO|nr:WD40-repeat-containing domain protein [Amylocarpus encephaloides]